MRFAHDIYYDEMVYVKARREMEPCRTMHTVFGDGNGRYEAEIVYNNREYDLLFDAQGNFISASLDDKK